MTTPTDTPLEILFTAARWSETPYDEPAGLGKLSRASIENVLSGAFTGRSVLEYLLAYPAIAGGEVSFVGYERLSGRLGQREGSFVLRHEGVFSPVAGVSGTLVVLPGSGSGDLSSVSGRGEILARAGEHGGVYRLRLA